MTAGRTILHVDMDAFYAAVEVREDPALRGRPVVVGADPREGRGRGVVATASYEAREFGIHSAMPISEAYRRCRHAVFVRPRMSLYSDVSDRIFEIFRSFTDLVEPLSLDEAFLDVTSSRSLFGDGPEIATAVRRAIVERERLTASVGVAPVKFLAKLASDLDKPDGLVVVPERREREFVEPLEVSRLWGAGARTQERLRRLRVRTIGDVARLGRARLVRHFGEAAGSRFHQLSHGIDARRVVPDQGRKSLGRETTFLEDLDDREAVEGALFNLCDQVGRRLRRVGLAGSTIAVKLRWKGFQTVTRQQTLAEPIDTTERLWPVARELFRKADRLDRPVRLVGIYVSGLGQAGERQLSLFEGAKPTDRVVAQTVDRLNEKFGRGSVTRAALLDRRPR